MEAITDQVRKPWVSSMDLKDVRIRHQFLPLSGRMWDPFKLVESMEKKGVASLPMLNMTGKSFLLGNHLSHVQIIENRMISIMDGKEKPDNQERSGEWNPPSPERGQEKTVVVIPQDDGDSPREDRDGDSPGEDCDGDSPDDGDSPGEHCDGDSPDGDSPEVRDGDSPGGDGDGIPQEKTVMEILQMMGISQENTVMGIPLMEIPQKTVMGFTQEKTVMGIPQSSDQ